MKNDTENNPNESRQLEQIKKWFEADRDHSAEWRKQAEEDYDFVAGKQWSEEDQRKLKREMRPVVTFNRMQPVINSVSGMEIGNRQEARFIPREQGDTRARCKDIMGWH